jgi:hypothetical protein
MNWFVENWEAIYALIGAIGGSVVTLIVSKR